MGRIYIQYMQAVGDTGWRELYLGCFLSNASFPPHKRHRLWAHHWICTCTSVTAVLELFSPPKKICFASQYESNKTEPRALNLLYKMFVLFATVVQHMTHHAPAHRVGSLSVMLLERQLLTCPEFWPHLYLDWTLVRKQRANQLIACMYIYIYCIYWFIKKTRVDSGRFNFKWSRSLTQCSFFLRPSDIPSWGWSVVWACDGHGPGCNPSPSCLRCGSLTNCSTGSNEPRFTCSWSGNSKCNDQSLAVQYHGYGHVMTCVC